MYGAGLGEKGVGLVAKGTELPILFRPWAATD